MKYNKTKYSSPEIVVEELIKQDVLLASTTEATENPDNIQQSFLNFGSWMDD